MWRQPQLKHTPLRFIHHHNSNNIRYSIEFLLAELMSRWDWVALSVSLPNSDRYRDTSLSEDLMYQLLIENKIGMDIVIV